MKWHEEDWTMDKMLVAVKKAKDIVKNSRELAIKERKFDIMDIIQGHIAIYCHPNNLPLLQTQFEEKTVQLGSYIAVNRPFQIVTNIHLKEFNEDEHWEITDKCPKSPFWEIVDDIKNPPSYAITWEWVRKVYIKEPIFYLINNKGYTVKIWN